MFEKTTLVLAVMTVLLFVESQGTPVIESADEDAIPAVSVRGPRISPSEWIKFNQNWTFPSFPSVSSLFYDDEKKDRGTILLRRRIDSLERTQKSIIEMLRNLTLDVNALSAALVEKEPEAQPQPILSTDPVINKDEITSEIQSSPNAVGEPVEQLPERIESPEVTQESVIIEKPASAPSIPQENVGPDSTAAEKNANRPHEIPEKIVIASTTLEENSGENPFGSISLVGFAPPQENRLNARMPWNKDDKSNEKAME